MHTDLTSLECPILDSITKAISVTGPFYSYIFSESSKYAQYSLT
jgi:hypothetical protein